MDQQDLLDLACRALAPSSAQAYRGDLRRAARRLDLPLAALVEQLQDRGRAQQLAGQLRERLVADGCAPRYCNRVLATLRRAVREWGRAGLLDWRLEIAGYKVAAYRDTRGPGLAGFRALLEGTDVSRPIGARDRCALVLSWCLGLRRGELCGLDLVDLVDASSALPRLRVRGKGGSDDLLTLPTVAVEAIWLWGRARGAAPGPLLAACGPSGQLRVPLARLQPAQWARHLAHLGERAQLAGRVRPHGLRHAAATTAAEDGAPAEYLRQFLRHRSLSTTSAYLDRVVDLAGRVAAHLARRTQLAPLEAGQRRELSAPAPEPWPPAGS